MEKSLTKVTLLQSAHASTGLNSRKEKGEKEDEEGEKSEELSGSDQEDGAWTASE